MAETAATNFGPGNYPDLAPGGQYEGAQIGMDLGPWGAPGTVVGKPFVDARGFSYDWKTGGWTEPAPEVEQPPTTEYKPVDLSQPFTPAMREPMAAPTGVRFNVEPTFGPVTPSGYAIPPVDPLSYYQGPTTMASGGGGGFDNLGGGFKGTTTPSVGITPSTTPSGGGATTTPSPGFTYKPGEYDPATGIGVIYTPGPDEQITPQPTTKPTGSPWGVAGGGGTGGAGGGGTGGGKYVTGPNSPYFGQQYGTPVPGQPGVYVGMPFVDNEGRSYDWETGLWSTPLYGPRFETEPVTVTIPVEQKQPTTTPATKTETATTAPAETKPTTTISPIRQTRIEVAQRPTVQIPKPTITPGITAQYEPFNFNEPPPSQPFKEPITVPADINRKVPPYRTGFQYINYDPEEILAAAMRSMGGSRARQSIAEEAQIFNRMRNR
jgi:hypothetical protein